MFYGLVAYALHEIRGEPGGSGALLAVLNGYLFAGCMALWVLADARRSRRSLPYDFGSFVFFTWPVFVPIYLIATRGWRAFVPIGYFILLYLAAVFLSSAVFVLHSP